MTTTTELVRGLPRRELLERIRFHHRQGEVAERALGFYLLDMERRKAYRPGFESAADWARRQLDLKRADKLILLAKRLEKLPKIRKAFDERELPWTKVREIARIADSDTEETWLDCARKSTSRELERQVEGKKRGDKPGGGLKARRWKYVETLRLLGGDKAIWDGAIRKILHELGKGATPTQAAVEIARRILASSPAGGEPAGKPGAGWCVVVFHQKADGSTWADTTEGPVPVDPEVLVKRIREGARVIHAKDIAGTGECSAILFGERGQVPPEERDPSISAELRAAVLARDGHRCLICGSTEDLTVHHFKSHAHGGKTSMECLGTLCVRCHGACHEGDILLRTETDGRVTALDRDGEVLGQFGPLAGTSGDGQHVLVSDAPGAGAGGPEPAALAGEATGESREAAEPLDCQPAAPHASSAAEPAEASPAVERPQGFASIDDLPEEIGAADFLRLLQPFLAWSPSHRAFIFCPDADLLEALVAASGTADGGVTASTEARSAAAERDTRAVRPAVRPGGFEDFVGQRRAVGNLLLAARAARGRGEALGHVLLSGPPGLGKTTLARLVAEECGSEIHEVVAGTIGSPSQVVEILARLKSLFR